MISTTRPRERGAPLFKPVIGRKRVATISPGTIQTFKVESSVIEDFSSLLSNQSLATKLKERGIKSPTGIQKALMQHMKLGKSDILIKAATGTGKTYGYIISSIEYILSSHDNKDGNNRGCRVLILVPNSVLGQQIIGWARDLYPEASVGSDPSCSIMVSAGRVGKIRVDLEAGKLQLDPELIIVDETDAMINPLSRRPTVKELDRKKLHPNEAIALLQYLRGKNNSVRIIYSTATMNICTKNELKGAGLISKDGAIYLDATAAENQEFGSRKTGISLPSTISHYYKVIDLADEECFLDAINIILSRESPNSRGLLLVQDGASKTDLLHFLDVSLNNGQLNPAPFVVDFMSSYNPQARLNIASYSDSRGFDDPKLGFVIILGLPPDTTSYQHMAGRVGRMGRSGNVYTLLNSLNEFELHRYTSFSKLLGIPVTSLSNPSPLK